MSDIIAAAIARANSLNETECNWTIFTDQELTDGIDRATVRIATERLSDEMLFRVAAMRQRYLNEQRRRAGRAVNSDSDDPSNWATTTMHL